LNNFIVFFLNGSLKFVFLPKDNISEEDQRLLYFNHKDSYWTSYNEFRYKIE